MRKQKNLYAQRVHCSLIYNSKKMGTTWKSIPSKRNDLVNYSKSKDEILYCIKNRVYKELVLVWGNTL